MASQTSSIIACGFDVDITDVASFIKENESKGSTLEGNVEFLNQKRNFHTFKPCRIIDVKNILIDNKIECRI